MGVSEVLNQVLGVYISFGIICAAIFIFYFIYSGVVSRKEEVLVFWIVIATIGVASFFLWPIFSMLLLWGSGIFNKKSSHRHSSDAKVGEDYCSSTSPDLEKIRSLWNEITDRSSALNSDLIDYLESDEVLSENERSVRNQFSELERLFSDWNDSISSFMESLPSNLPDQNLKYFSPNDNWPKLNLRIIVKYDIDGKPVGVSHSTILTLAPNFEDSFVSYFPRVRTRSRS